MRESQKMRLDVRLHTKIIDSIIRIQLWFRGILQRRKFTTHRSAAITIQSYWRMYVAQKQYQLKKSQVDAVVLIQATWRMFVTRKWYNRLRKGVVIVQAHIRGKLARINFSKAHRQVGWINCHEIFFVSTFHWSHTTLELNSRKYLRNETNCVRHKAYPPMNGPSMAASIVPITFHITASTQTFTVRQN